LIKAKPQLQSRGIVIGVQETKKSDGMNKKVQEEYINQLKSKILKKRVVHK